MGMDEEEELICNACVYSIARIEYNNFNPLHTVAAMPFLAVDMNNDNRACTVHPSNLAPLSIHPFSFLSCIPYHPSSLIPSHQAP